MRCRGYAATCYRYKAMGFICFGRRTLSVCIQPRMTPCLLFILLQTTNQELNMNACTLQQCLKQHVAAGKRETFFKLIQMNIYNWLYWKSGTAGVAHLWYDGYDAVCLITYLYVYLLNKIKTLTALCSVTTESFIIVCIMCSIHEYYSRWILLMFDAMLIFLDYLFL